MTPAPERPARQRVSDEEMCAACRDQEGADHPYHPASMRFARELRDARATIAGLREENERLKAENLSRKLQAQARWAPYTDWAIEAFLKTDDGDVRGLARELVQTREDRARAEAALARLTQPDEDLAELLKLALACEGDEADWRNRAKAALAARPAPETSATRGETTA